MIFFENRFPLFGIMLERLIQASNTQTGTGSSVCGDPEAGVS
jgi:hypothetical protein